MTHGSPMIAFCPLRFKPHANKKTQVLLSGSGRSRALGQVSGYILHTHFDRKYRWRRVASRFFRACPSGRWKENIVAIQETQGVNAIPFLPNRRKCGIPALVAAIQAEHHQAS
jgi:hypothetical protein